MLVKDPELKAMRFEQVVLRGYNVPFLNDPKLTNVMEGLYRVNMHEQSSLTQRLARLAEKVSVDKPLHFRRHSDLSLLALLLQGVNITVVSTERHHLFLAEVYHDGMTYRIGIRTPKQRVGGIHGCTYYVRYGGSGDDNPAERFGKHYKFYFSALTKEQDLHDFLIAYRVIELMGVPEEFMGLVIKDKSEGNRTHLTVTRRQTELRVRTENGTTNGYYVHDTNIVKI